MNPHKPHDPQTSPHPATGPAMVPVEVCPTPSACADTIQLELQHGARRLLLRCPAGQVHACVPLLKALWT